MSKKNPQTTEAMSKAIGKCPKCGRIIKWFNGIPLKGFCWGTEEEEHSEYSALVPPKLNPYMH